MIYKTNPLPKSQLEILVTVPFEEFEPHVKRAAVFLSEEHAIEGFRRGKASYDIVKQKFGEAVVYERGAELAVRKTYPGILEELAQKPPPGVIEFLPLGAPEVTITKLAPGNELVYKAVVARMPEIALPDYKAIARDALKEKREVSITEEEVDKTIKWVRESRAEYFPVRRPAEQGDAVEIDFELRADGVKIANGDSRNHPLIIGKSRFMPGFEDNLIGMVENEEKTFSLSVPADWHEKSLAGKDIGVKVTMRAIKEHHVPELNDEFACRLGNFATVASLRTSIKDSMAEEKKEKEKQRMRALCAERIAEKIDAVLPDVLIELELDKMFDELKTGVEDMEMKWEDYLLHIKKNLQELRSDWRVEAMKRVRIALVLREIAKRENIRPSEDEIDGEAHKFLARFKTTEDAKNTIDPARLREYTRGTLRNQKVFEFLEQMADSK